MLLVYLVLGVAFGLAAAVTAWLAGVSAAGVLGLFVLGGIGGIAARALAVALRSLLGRLASALGARQTLPRGDALEQ